MWNDVEWDGVDDSIIKKFWLSFLKRMIVTLTVLIYEFAQFSLWHIKKKPYYSK